MQVREKYTVLDVIYQHTGLTRKKVLLAMETQRKTENNDDIYFRTVCEVDCMLIEVVDTWNNFIGPTKL